MFTVVAIYNSQDTGSSLVNWLEEDIYTGYFPPLLYVAEYYSAALKKIEQYVLHSNMDTRDYHLVVIRLEKSKCHMMYMDQK